MVVGSSPVAVTKSSDMAPASSKEFLDIQATAECGFTLKLVRDTIKTYNHIYRAQTNNKESISLSFKKENTRIFKSKYKTLKKKTKELLLIASL